MIGASPWVEIGSGLVLAIAGGAVAVFWPWMAWINRGHRFQTIIKGELEEIGPWPGHRVAEKQAWWEYLEKRFIHEEIFKTDNISGNRDFLLSLNPQVVYQVSQLWTAFEKGDPDGWMYFLGKLSMNSKVRSGGLHVAVTRWQMLMDELPPEALEKCPT